jgi:homoserine acetyltransferase
VAVHRTTLYRWMRLGRDQKRGRYRKFLSQVEKAQAEAESRDVALIAKAASEDWRAAAWRLERKQPRRYGARVQLSVQQELDAVLDRLKKGLDPATYDKVLDLIAAEDSPGAPEPFTFGPAPDEGQGPQA